MSKISHCISIGDMKALARKKIPSVMFDYIDGGAEDERTLNWNRNAFEKYEFIPRVLRDVSEIDLSAKVQGRPLKLPLIAAPTGMSCMFHYRGEKAVAKAVHKAGGAYTLSAVGTTSIEDIAACSDGPKFFQIYVWHNKAMVQDFILRSRQQGYDGLMLAVDLATLGKRERDIRNGHGRPNLLKLKTGLSALSKPAWLYHYLTQPKWRMANMTAHLPHGALAVKVIDEVNEQFSATVDWKDAAALCKQWNGPFILKGIQCVEDAVKAAEIGATGIVISNHGGRQLDGAPATLDLLPEVVEAVGTDLEVLIDGGIMRGADVIKAIALGAKSVLVGRAYLYGLAAGGQAGVYRVFEILKDEMTRVMQLIGCTSIKALDSSYIRLRNSF
ncbi:alpha-hydroxy acid oxidase [Aestuariivivens sediminicola]|uniref:alpha-hydroxy acid oxidase n=1 Tax=Aestuariivivens sediminicola TaxID=2913560 RepID=UPI001F577934|nr:alpha-hydroxy acid oxidase [Aestuariivivens sediminicola]